MAVGSRWERANGSYRSVALMLASLAPILAKGDNVVRLTSATFDQHIKEYPRTLIEFYAPWCGHCQKLAPEYEKAAKDLKAHGVPLAQVDATEEKDLGNRYNVKGFPTLMWFEDGKRNDFDGGRTAEEIIEWVKSMIGPAVSQGALEEPLEDKPQVVLYADALYSGFEAAAKLRRRKAKWYFVRSPGLSKVVLTHKGEEPIELANGCDEEEKVSTFVAENLLPMFGKLDAASFDRYIEAGKGLIWALFPMEGKKVADIQSEHRAMMTEVAHRFRGNYFVTVTDTKEYKEAVDSMLGVSEFPAIAVQKVAGDKRKYVYRGGDLTARNIIEFIEDVDSGRAAPMLKSEDIPVSNNEPVRVVVSQTLESEVFTPDKDVLLEIYAPWCGHCKKLEPEYVKLAKKIRKEDLTSFLTIAKMDGTANDSPIDGLEWTGFPHIIFAKAGNSTPMVYDGERTAKALYKFIRKHATKALEIRDRLESKKYKEAQASDL